MCVLAVTGCNSQELSASLAQLQISLDQSKSLSDSVGQSSPGQLGFSHLPAKIESAGGNLFQLTHRLRFVDSAGRPWIAEQGTLTDGASIPRWALSFIGPPLDPRYREAAIVHDAYCGDENEGGPSYEQGTWQSVHRMFYEACIANGTGRRTAKVMFFAVWRWGPKWDEEESVTDLNVPVGLAARLYDAWAANPEAQAGAIAQEDMTEQQEFQIVMDWIEAEDPTPEAIEAAAGWLGTRR